MNRTSVSVIAASILLSTVGDSKVSLAQTVDVRTAILSFFLDDLKKIRRFPLCGQYSCRVDLPKRQARKLGPDRYHVSGVIHASAKKMGFNVQIESELTTRDCRLRIISAPVAGRVSRSYHPCALAGKAFGIKRRIAGVFAPGTVHQERDAAKCVRLRDQMRAATNGQ